MRANLRLDVEICLAYNFGQPKSIFLAFFYVKSYFGRGRVFFLRRNESIFLANFIVYSMETIPRCKLESETFFILSSPPKHMCMLMKTSLAINVILRQDDWTT